ncbi:MAG: hypothetical protein RJA90_549 [Bacteroidota bacterium]|jgi:uncharacterized membrane protein
MTQASSVKDRLQFIDAIRAYAILMMLQGHFVDTMLAYRFRDLENALYSTWFFMRGMTAPIFFTVTGLVFTFLLLRDGRPIKENERIRKGIRRGFFLIFMGYLLKVNFPAFLIGWFYKSYPALDVLHNIGFALLALIGLYCLHLISKISLPLLYFGGGIFIFLINPTWLAYEWDFLPIILRNYFDADNGSIFLPVPWLGFTLLGAGIGWHLFHKTYLYRTWYWPAILLTTGLTLHFFSTKGLLLLNQWTGWANFLQLAYDNVLFWRFGHVLIIISLFIFLEKIITFPPLMLKIGSETLTIYATHYVVLYGTWLGIGIKTFGQFTWHPIPVIIGAILFVLAAIVYIKYIEEIRTKLALHLPGRLRYLRRYIYIMGKRLLKQVLDQVRQWINRLSTNLGIW